ncbi:MAG: hypothetical protein HYZ57_05120 [Acidobacteria bacterium]|nr:hypothetical protein [Acidobacteriota bacterium]MBI3279207.1 hypothetical protein [Acidobacteriota bacterium]
MGAQPETPDREPVDAGLEGWNYFNYFTEVEDHFRRARGTGLFLMSSVDWALVETWKNSGIPLAAVLRGIDAAFEKWHSRKRKLRMVNSVSYCSQAVAEEAQRMAGAAPACRLKPVEAPFTLEELRGHLEACAAALRGRPGYDELASSLERLASEAEQHYTDLEPLEQRLTALEEKMAAVSKASQTEEQLVEARRELDATLRPYRHKMSAEQIAMLERQYLDRRLLESAGLPRLSLFYIK